MIGSCLDMQLMCIRIHMLNFDLLPTEFDRPWKVMVNLAWPCYAFKDLQRNVHLIGTKTLSSHKIQSLASESLLTFVKPFMLIWAYRCLSAGHEHCSTETVSKQDSGEPFKLWRRDAPLISGVCSSAWNDGAMPIVLLQHTKKERFPNPLFDGIFFRV